MVFATRRKYEQAHYASDAEWGISVFIGSNGHKYGYVFDIPDPFATGEEPDVELIHPVPRRPDKKTFAEIAFSLLCDEMNRRNASSPDPKKWTDSILADKLRALEPGAIEEALARLLTKE